MSRPLSPNSETDAAGLARVAAIIALAATALLFLNKSFFRGDYSGDEASHVMIARNILVSFDYLVRPSITPEGNFEEKKNVISFPPADPLVRAGGIALFSGHYYGSAFVNALFFALLLFALYECAALFDRKAALWTVMLASFSPGLLWLMSQLEADPITASAGMAGLFLLIKAWHSDRKSFAFAGGLLMGLAFVIKLYLILPYLVALGVYAVALRKLPMKLVVSAGAGFALTGGSHLALVAIASPDDLGFWLERVYFGALNPGSTSGDKFTGDLRHPGHNHPFWYYLAILYRDHFVLVPVVLLGGLQVLRMRKLRPLVLALGAGVACILVFSIPATKEPLYILPSVVLLYLLGGFALKEASRARRRQRLVAAGFSIVVLTGILAAAVAGVKPDDITPFYAATHTAFHIGVLYYLFRPSRTLPTAMLAGMLAYQITVLIANTRTNEAIATVLRPPLESASVQAMSILVENLNEPQMLLHRSGQMWLDLTDEECAHPEALFSTQHLRTIRAWVISEDIRSNPRYATVVAWVRENGENVTRRLDALSHNPRSVEVYLRKANP